MIYAEHIFLCMLIPLLLSLLFVRSGARRYVASFVLGMTVCLLSAYISGFLSVTAGMDSVDAAVFISPIVEETMKFLPLLFWLYMLMPGDESLTMIAVGIGAGFSTFENCCYILSSGAESFSYVLVRGMAVGVMHIVSMLTLSLALSVARRFKALSFPGIVGALSLSMSFHGLYNLLVSGPAAAQVTGYILPMLTATILYGVFRMLHIFGKTEG